LLEQLVLLSDEMIRGRLITKFPGGGLEFGEGPAECIVREFREETGLEVEVLSHFYTTDFFVRSAFDNECQVISIYYTVGVAEKIKKLDLITAVESLEKDPDQKFRWVRLSELVEDDLSLVIDKKVAQMLSVSESV